VVTTAGVLNYIWLALVLLAVAIGGWNDRLKDVTGGALDGEKTAVTIALGLIGIMALWLGLMRPNAPGLCNGSRTDCDR
jgi:spore maturation protein A